MKALSVTTFKKRFSLGQAPRPAVVWHTMRDTAQEVRQRTRKAQAATPTPWETGDLVSFGLPVKDGQFLELVCQFEGRSASELLRAMFLTLKEEYRDNPVFRRWAEKNREKLKVEEFIDVDEVLP